MGEISGRLNFSALFAWETGV